MFCYENRPQELEWWNGSVPWKEKEKRGRAGFGAWLWQAHHPTALAQDLFMREIEWQTAHPMPRCHSGLYLAGFVLFSWLGTVPSGLGYHLQPIRSAPDPRSFEMIETIIRREWLPWPSPNRGDFCGRALVILKSAGRMELDLLRHAVTVAPDLAICNEVNNTGALEPELADVVYEFAAELSEENSHRFCYFGWPSGARWVIRACENVERLGLVTLASLKPDVYDRNHAIRKISAIKAFLPTDDRVAFKAELSRFSPTTRRLVAGCSDVAREDLLEDPECAPPPAYEEFKKLETMSATGSEIEALPAFDHESYRARTQLTPGGPDLVIEKDGRALKSVPAALKKVAGFVTVREQIPQLAERFGQFSEMLEE